MTDTKVKKTLYLSPIKVHLYRIRDDLYRKPLTRIVILFDYVIGSMLSTTSQKEEVIIKSCVNGN